MPERTIALRDHDEERLLFGHLDRNLHVLRRLMGVDATSRGGSLRLKGEEGSLDDAVDAVEDALDRIRDGRIDDPLAVERLFRENFEDRRGGNVAPATPPPAAREDRDDPTVGRRRGDAPRERGPATGDFAARASVQPRGRNQQAYLDAIDRHSITFGIGPAGTGKSFLAVASAVKFLRTAQYRKIVLCRPAVEAGENLGFLPGDLEDKINPYLRPLYDALQTLLPTGALRRYMDEEIIEILPLAYMRGRTLDHSVIILDEAQNATVAQMKMFLTRLGEHSKMIVTGDMTQTDLPRSKPSGLVHAVRILDGLRDVAFQRFAEIDVVRHPVVRDVIRAYERAENWEQDDRGDDHGGERCAPERRDEANGDRGFGAGVFAERDDRGRDAQKAPRRESRDRDHRHGPRGRRGRH